MFEIDSVQSEITVCTTLLIIHHDLLSTTHDQYSAFPLCLLKYKVSPNLTSELSLLSLPPHN